MDDRVTIEHAASDVDANAGINVVVAMTAKGKKSEEIMASLCMAMAVCNVIFSPDEAAKDQNHEKSAEFVKNVTADMWERRDELEGLVSSRVARLMPAARLFDLMFGKRLGPDNDPMADFDEHATKAV